MVILETKNLTKRFGGLEAVSNVDIKISSGIHAIIGPNGAGKSTLVNLITGVIQPTEGEIIFDNEDITKMTSQEAIYKGMARTFQNLSLFNKMTVYENISFGYFSKIRKRNMFAPIFNRSDYKAQYSEIEEKAKYLMEFLGIDKWRNEEVGNVPYGVQKIVEMARILMSDAKILFLDEPAAGLNSIDKDILRDAMLKVAKDGKTIVLIEHSMKMVMSTADYITVIQNGKKIAEGTPVEIQNDPVVIEAYLGKGAESYATN